MPPFLLSTEYALGNLAIILAHKDIMIHPWQSAQWQQIQSQLQQQRLAHGLLFQGCAGLGKKDFAHFLAAAVLCQSPKENAQACGQCASCQLLSAGTHPDLTVLAPEETGKAIKVDDVRRLSASMSLTSQLSGYKLAVIESADQMNVNAANSLLKTLEEPASQSLLILISDHPERLPITIRSRCQQLVFQKPAVQQAQTWLQQQGLANADLLLKLAHGAPFLALQMNQGEYLEQRQQLLQALLGIAGRKPVLDFAAKLAKLPSESLLAGLYDWLADLLKLHQCGESVDLVHQDQAAALKKLVKLSSVQSLYVMLDQVNQYTQFKSIPLNAQMLWEDLLLSWQRQIKRV